MAGDGREPVLVYDDDCGVCTRAAVWVARRSVVELRGFSELSDSECARLPEAWRRCAHLLIDGDVYSCGEAMQRSFELTDHPMTRMARPLRRVPGYHRALEAGYRIFADQRSLVGRFLSD